MSFLSKSELQKLVGQNKTRQAIDALLEITNSADDKVLHDEVKLQSSLFQQYEKDKLDTTTNSGDTIKRINDALRRIINKLPDPPLSSTDNPVEERRGWTLWEYVVSLGVVLGLFAAIAEFTGYSLKDIFFSKSSSTEQLDKPTPSSNSIFQADSIDSITKTAYSSNSIFQADDQSTFNILIIRFEDYIAGEDTHCIGRAIEEHLNVMALIKDKKFSLPLKAVYVADSISPPRNQKEAMMIQNRHHSDLIIYGLVRQVEENCSVAEVCFRYNISEQVIANMTSDVDIKPAKHDAKYTRTSPIAIELGKLQIDSVSMKYWISSLINIKAKKVNEAFLDLADLTDKDTVSLSDVEKSRRYIIAGNTYYSYKKYKKAIASFDEAIELDPRFAYIYNSRGNVYRNLKDYKRAIADYKIAIELSPEDAGFHIGRGNVYADLKDYKMAIADYKTAIYYDQKSVYAHCSFAFICLKLKQFNVAIQYLKKSEELDPNNKWIYRTWTCYYALRNQKALALQNLEKGIRLGFDDVEWLEEESSLASLRQAPRFKVLLNSISKK